MNDQRPLLDQLQSLYGLANQNGLYDAADWLKERLDALKAAQRARVQLTDPQKALLASLKEETVTEGAWTQVFESEARSAEALARKGLIRTRGERPNLEAQLIEDGPSAFEATHPNPRT